LIVLQSRGRSCADRHIVLQNCRAAKRQRQDGLRRRSTSKAGELVGAIGDTGENDERIAVAALEHCGLVADLS
jgi:hypothetical protein